MLTNIREALVQRGVILQVTPDLTSEESPPLSAVITPVGDYRKPFSWRIGSGFAVCFKDLPEAVRTAWIKAWQNNSFGNEYGIQGLPVTFEICRRKKGTDPQAVNVRLDHPVPGPHQHIPR